MGDYIVQIIVPVFISLIASSGFWLAVMKRIEKRGLQTELLIGLAHDRITNPGLYYISQGYIGQDEYENLNDYLFKPYSALGGNGTAKRIMQEIDKLPIRKDKAHVFVKGERNDSVEQSL